MTNQTKGILAAILAGITYASYGVFTRYAGESAGPFLIGFLRSIPVLFIVIPIGLYKKSFTKINPKDTLWLLLFVIAAQFGTAPFSLAILSGKVTIGEVLFIFYASSILISYFLGWLFYSEKLNSLKIAAIAVSALGLVMLYQVTFTDDKLYGILMSLLAGFGFGFYSTVSKKISNKYSKEQLSLFNYLPFFITMPVLIALTEEKVVIDDTGVLWSMVFGLAAIAAGYLILIAFKHLEAQKASLILLLEPVIAAILGALLFSEGLPPKFILAASLIIIAAALPNLKK